MFSKKTEELRNTLRKQIKDQNQNTDPTFLPNLFVFFNNAIIELEERLEKIEKDQLKP